MTALILGVDLGKTGALALLSPAGNLIEVADVPTLADGAKGRPTVNIGARPTDSKVGAFAFCRSRGAVEGVLGSQGVPTRFLRAPAWKRIIGIPMGAAVKGPSSNAKDAARLEAVRRRPAQAALFARKSDDGRAEAALIAVAGMIRDAQGIAPA